MPVTSVKIGNESVPYTVVSSTQIKATAGTQSGQVTVSATNGIATGPSFQITTPSGPTISSFTPTTGGAGTFCTITGTNFINVNSVKIGGISCTYTVVSTTQIKATIPNIAAGSYTFSVTTAYGTGISTGQFTVITPPPPGDYILVAGNIHCHTSYSDGADTPDTRFKAMRDLDNVAQKAYFGGITDHYSSLTSTEFKDICARATQYTQDGEFVAIGGIEMAPYIDSSNEGEMCTWNFDNYNLVKPSGNYYDWLRTNYPDAMCHWNHPKDDTWAFDGATREREKVVVGLEIFNAGHGTSETEWNKCLNKGWRVAPFGNGDYHSKTPFTSTEIRTYAWTTALTRSSLYEAFRARRVYATLAKNITIDYKINDTWMGSVTPVAPLNVVANVNSPDNTITKMEIITNGGVVAATVSPNAKTYNWTTTLPAKAGFYYLKVTLGSTSKFAVTAPVFVE